MGGARVSGGRERIQRSGFAASFRQDHVRFVSAGGHWHGRVAAVRKKAFFPSASCRRITFMALPQYYATAMPTRGSAIPLLVRSSDGRPTKIEGNSGAPNPSNRRQQRSHMAGMEARIHLHRRRYWASTIPIGRNVLPRVATRAPTPQRWMRWHEYFEAVRGQWRSRPGVSDGAEQLAVAGSAASGHRTEDAAGQVVSIRASRSRKKLDRAEQSCRNSGRSVLSVGKGQSNSFAGLRLCRCRRRYLFALPWLCWRVVAWKSPETP